MSESSLSLRLVTFETGRGSLAASSRVQVGCSISESASASGTAEVRLVTRLWDLPVHRTSFLLKVGPLQPEAQCAQHAATMLPVPLRQRIPVRSALEVLL